MLSPETYVSIDVSSHVIPTGRLVVSLRSVISDDAELACISAKLGIQAGLCVITVRSYRAASHRHYPWEVSLSVAGSANSIDRRFTFSAILSSVFSASIRTPL